MNIGDYIKIIVTSVSFIDFVVFTVLFSVYLCVVQYKAKEIKNKIGGFVILLVFLAFKLIHVPVFLSTIVLFKWDIPYANEMLLSLTWSNIMLALVPLVAVVMSLIRNYFNDTTNIDEYKFDKINIIMPIYNEDPQALWDAVKSVEMLDYNLKNIHLYLSFDDLNDSDAYKYIMEKLNLSLEKDKNKNECVRQTGLKITVCKFKHGGKKSAQQGAYNMIKMDYKQAELKDSKVFLMDSDIQLKEDCMWNFIKYMKIYKKSCLTGIITCVTSKNNHFLAYYQDVEYISGQIFWRNLEGYCGATSCLPGAFTILNWNSFDNVAHSYFSKTEYSDIFEYQRFYLGEDRYLTHLLMEAEYGKIGFCDKATCKTDAPISISTLLKQRKRWFLGHISNDTWMISSPKFWYNYPLLTLFNFLNNSRNTSIYIYLLYFVLFFDKSLNVFTWFMYILSPIILNWMFIMYYSFLLKRRMNIIYYIIIIVFQPIFSMMYMYYTIYNIRVNSWGGPRTDNIKKDDKMIEIKIDNDMVEINVN